MDNKVVCGEDCQIFSRVVGYFRPVKNWHKGKQEEFKQRKLFKFKLTFVNEGPVINRLDNPKNI